MKQLDIQKVGTITHLDKLKKLHSLHEGSQSIRTVDHRDVYTVTTLVNQLLDGFDLMLGQSINPFDQDSVEVPELNVHLMDEKNYF